MSVQPIRSANKNTTGLACEKCGVEITPGVRYQVVSRQGRRGTVVRCVEHQVVEKTVDIVVHWNGYNVPVRLIERDGAVRVVTP